MTATNNFDPANQMQTERDEKAEMEQFLIARLDEIDVDESDDEEDDGPSTYEIWQQMANDGDTIGLCNVWANALPEMLDLRYIAGYLQQAVMIRARKDPMSFNQEILTDILGVVGLMVLRSHVHLQQMMREQDEHSNRRGAWSDTRDMAEILPKVIDLQRHFAELSQINASTQRLAELARQRQLENEKPPKAATRKRKLTKRFTSKRKASSRAGNRMA